MKYQKLTKIKSYYMYNNGKGVIQPIFKKNRYIFMSVKPFFLQIYSHTSVVVIERSRYNCFGGGIQKDLSLQDL